MDFNIKYPTLVEQSYEFMKQLKPDYLEIDGLAHEIIKYCKQVIKYNETKN